MGLRKDFEECGPVTEIKLLKDAETGRSRGIAFITFATKEGVKKALEFDGDDYGGRNIKVNLATPKGDGKGKGKSKGPGEKPVGCTSVVVKGLSYEVTEDDLRKNCNNVKLLTDRETGESKGIGFVDFDDGKQVDEAIKLNNTELKGRTFFMDYARPRV